MRFIPLVVAFCGGCASAPIPVAEVAPPPPLTEYNVPLIFADGHIEQITVEDDKPGEGIVVLFCKDMPAQIICLANENGVARWMSVPKVATGNDAV